MTSLPIRSFATATCLMAIAIAAPPQLLAQQESRPEVTIGMVLDGPMVRYGDLVDLVRQFCQHKVGAIPVVENERVVGIVTQTDMMQAFLAVLESQ